MSSEYISFREGLLGEEPNRLKVLYADEGVLALEKPQGVLIDAHPRYKGVPSIVAALWEQVKEGKPELLPYGIDIVKSVYFLEPEVTGVCLLAINESSVGKIRNLYGSEKMKFYFQLLGKEEGVTKDTLECSLPLAEKESGGVWVSHKRGKKTATVFRRIERCGDYALWDAEVNYIRMHQIRVHAKEVGLRLLGEDLYGEGDSVYLSDLKRNYKQKEGEERPLFDGLFLHLERVEWMDDLENGCVINCPLPKSSRVLLDKLSHTQV